MSCLVQFPLRLSTSLSQVMTPPKRRSVAVKVLRRNRASPLVFEQGRIKDIFFQTFVFSFVKIACEECQ